MLDPLLADLLARADYPGLGVPGLRQIQDYIATHVSAADFTDMA